MSAHPLTKFAEAAEELELGMLVCIRLVCRREYERRVERWLEDPGAFREEIAEAHDAVLGPLAEAWENAAEEHPPWERDGNENLEALVDATYAEIASRGVEA